jgi:predicted amidophosphoribosyltransferase
MGVRSVDELGAVLVRAARDVARLVLPVECPGCGLLDELLCGRCGAALLGSPVRCEADVPRLDRMDGHAPLPVWCVAPYAGPVRGIVVGWKDHGRADLSTPLGAAVRRAALELAPVVGAAAEGQVVRVVPVPSTPGARRRRGADLVGLLAGAVSAGLRTGGTPAAVAPALRRRAGARDQVGLGAAGRRSNAAGSVTLARRPLGHGPVRGEVHLLVDDVITTGSTLADCEDALTSAGGVVLGALVIAATPSPAPRRRLLLPGGAED